MGVLRCNDRASGFEDRVLAHVQIVGVTKPRRRECFLLRWLPEPHTGTGGQALWIGAGVPLDFAHRARTMPLVSRTWIECLLAAANNGALNTNDQRNTEPAATA